MRKILGILAVFVLICGVTAIANPQFFTAYNVTNLLVRSSLLGIIGIGAAFVIITGGIDLSIGSVVALCGCLLPYLLVEHHWSIPAAVAGTMSAAVAIGLLQGLLITRARLQPFVVTLAGLLICRGVTRWFTDEQNQGFGNDFAELKWLATAKLPIPGLTGWQVPFPVVILLVISLLAWVVLNRTIVGRYLLAIGGNRDAARYSGIQTERWTLVAYLISATLAGLGGIMFALDANSVQPASFGEAFELYAIAAAVLGGCSLRGGEGTIFGVVIGAAVLRVLANSILLLGVPSKLEYTVIGIVILLGALADEGFHRLTAYRQLARLRRRAASTSSH